MQILFWIFTLVSCQAVASSSCGDPPVFANSVNNLTSSAPFAENTVVDHNCSIEYRPEGFRLFTCVDGNWQGGPFECVRNYCPFLNPPEHGSISNSPTYKLNSFIEFSCDSGYTRQGSSSLRCRLESPSPNSRLIWVGTPPTCQVVTCGSFGDVQNGKVFQISPDGVLDDYGSVVLVTCNDGYTLSEGKKRLTCQADGTWERKPSCIELVCPDYPGLNTSCVDEVTVESGLLLMYCISEPGKVSRTGNDDGSALCMSGAWSNTDVSCPCNCPCQSGLTQVLYDNCNTQNYLPHTTRLTWRCAPGYRKKTVGEITCHDGLMSQNPECEEIPTTKAPSTPSPSPKSTIKYITDPDPNGRDRPKDEDTSWSLCWLLVLGLLALFVGLISVTCVGFCKSNHLKQKDHCAESPCSRPAIAQY